MSNKNLVIAFGLLLLSAALIAPYFGISIWPGPSRSEHSRHSYDQVGEYAPPAKEQRKQPLRQTADDEKKTTGSEQRESKTGNLSEIEDLLNSGKDK